MTSQEGMFYTGVDVVQSDGIEYFVHVWLKEGGAEIARTIELKAEQQRQQLREGGHDEHEIAAWMDAARRAQSTRTVRG